METNESIIVEEHFNVPIEVLWNAISNHSTMIKWYFENIPTFKPEVGFKTEFPVQSGERTFTHLWQVVEVKPLKKLVYNWKFLEYPGDSNVSFELFEEKNSVRLKLTSKIVKSFPEDIPEFEIESGIQGWNYFIKNRLKNFLDKPE